MGKIVSPDSQKAAAETLAVAISTIEGVDAGDHGAVIDSVLGVEILG